LTLLSQKFFLSVSISFSLFRRDLNPQIFPLTVERLNRLATKDFFGVWEARTPGLFIANETRYQTAPIPPEGGVLLYPLPPKGGESIERIPLLFGKRGIRTPGTFYIRRFSRSVHSTTLSSSQVFLILSYPLVERTPPLGGKRGYLSLN
jgi:hypothetical protein